MFHWIKRKKVIVDAFTHSDVIAMSPIIPASKALPDWFKKLKTTIDVDAGGLFNKMPTFKRCDGMTDLIKGTYVMPMWADLSIVTFKDGRWHWKFPSDIYNYGLQEFPNSLMDSAFSPLMHIKINGPWLLEEKTGVNFFQTQATYSHNNIASNIVIPPGVTNYKYQKSLNINTFLARDKQFFFPAGMPMMYIVPMTEYEVEIKTHVVSIEEWRKKDVTTAVHKFMGGYKELKAKGGIPL